MNGEEWTGSHNHNGGRVHNANAAVEYTRRAGDDAPIDVAAVTQLLKHRAEMRTKRDFKGADSIRDTLRDMAVIVHDHKMEVWAAPFSCVWLASHRVD